MVNTTVQGIFQSDIIIRTAVMAAIEDLRAQPWLLDFVFRSLVDDELTRKFYGEGEICSAKDWFLENDIPVAIAYNLEEITTPLICITLQNSDETETTLGDINYDTHEDVDPQEIDVLKPVVGPVSPTNFDSTTGILTFASGVNLSKVFVGMQVQDRLGNAYIINELDEHSVTIELPGKKKPNFSKCTIGTSQKSYVASLESASYRESFRIDLYISGKPAHLFYLHSILVFALNRYKQKYLEARGFERTSLSSTPAGVWKPDDREVIFTRAIMVSGYVRQYWPKDIRPKIDGVASSQSVAPTADAPTATEDDGWTILEDEFPGS